jgi:hypothetical protein
LLSTGKQVVFWLIGGPDPTTNLIDNYKRNMVPLMKLEKRTANLVFARQGKSAQRNYGADA